MSATQRVPAPRRLGLRDLVAVGAGGLATRRLRATLSALGIAIGIAAITAVLGVSESSKADLLAQLDRLGTNLLTVAPGQTFGGEDATLPLSSVGMIRRIRPVQQAAAVAAVSDAAVYRNDRIPPGETGGLSVAAADLDLLQAVAQADPAQRQGGQPAPLAWRGAAVEQAHGHVVQGAEVVEQEELLEDQADGAGAQPGQLPVRQPADLDPAHLDGALAGPVQGAHQVQQGRLARARGPGDRQHLPGGDGEVDVAQHLQGRRAGVALAHPAQLQHRPTGREHGGHWAVTTLVPARRPAPETSTMPLENTPRRTATRWWPPAASTVSTA